MEIENIGKNQWKIKGKIKDQIIFADESMLNELKKDLSLEQLKNVSNLPGLVNSPVAMPDAHQGYGFPIGAVAAFDLESGVISPGGVGYDINCGVRLLKTNLEKKDIEKKEEIVLKKLFDAIPSGVGARGKIKISLRELDELLNRGVQWAKEKRISVPGDIENCEEKGSFKEADASKVSKRAKERGLPQIGTLGAGNHFLEILEIKEIFNEKSAKVMGLKKEGLVILIHTGSRGLGHQVASDYIKKIQESCDINFEKSLYYAPIKSKIGQDYLKAMRAAANFAFVNRQILSFLAIEAIKKIFPNFQAELVYDVCHNIAKIETHIINGKERAVLVLRKGATRSFGPENKNTPEKYKEIGQPVIIPGSMGTSSYVLTGTSLSEKLSFGSSPHGAGRKKSRTEVRKTTSYEKVKKFMEKKKIYVKSRSKKSMVEESSESYKDVEEIVRITKEAGLADPVAKLAPRIVIIG